MIFAFGLRMTHRLMMPVGRSVGTLVKSVPPHETKPEASQEHTVSHEDSGVGG